MFKSDIINTYIKNKTFDLSNYNPCHSDRRAIIFESRTDENLHWVIDNIKYYTNWNVTLYHTKLNADFVNDIECDKICLDVINITSYNKMLLDSVFWSAFSEEWILIFQSDSFMLRNGMDSYIKPDMDYIGAPWWWLYDTDLIKASTKPYGDLLLYKMGGNGGFSLRNTKSMYNITASKITKSDFMLNEDMAISKHLFNNLTLIDKQKFSTESIFYDAPMAIHAIDKYLTEEEIKIIINNAL